MTLFESLFDNTSVTCFSERKSERRACDFLGRWDMRTSSFKRLTLPKKDQGIPIYELKAYQDRVLLVREQDDALVVKAFVKKDDWSKKDARILSAAAKDAASLLQRFKRWKEHNE